MNRQDTGKTAAEPAHAQPKAEGARTVEAAAVQLSRLVTGMALLVLAGMNLFTNLLDVSRGGWIQNQAVAWLLTIATTAIPAAAGIWLVLAGTGPVTPRMGAKV